jgi:hypothetical protein
MPDATTKALGILHIVEDAIQQVPQSHHPEQGTWQHMTLKRPHLFFNLRLPIDKDKTVLLPPAPLHNKRLANLVLTSYGQISTTNITNNKSSSPKQPQKAWNLDPISTLFSNQLLHMLIIKSITKLVPTHTLRGGLHVFFGSIYNLVMKICYELTKLSCKTHNLIFF